MKLKELYLKKPDISYREKEYDFTVSDQMTSNFLINKNGKVSTYFSETSTGRSIDECSIGEKLFYRDDILFLITGMGCVRPISMTSNTNYGEIDLGDYDLNVKVTTLYNNGEKFYLIANQTHARVYNSTFSSYTAVNIPFGEGLMYNERLFIGNGREIKYSEKFNYSNFNNGIGFGGYIKLKEEDGNIVKMFNINEKLVIVCKHKILFFSANGEEDDYTLKRLDIAGFDILDVGCVKIGECIYFMDNKKIYCLKDKTLSYEEINIANIGIDTNHTIGAFKNYLIIPTTYNVENYGLCYDTVSKKQSVVACRQIISDYGGYIMYGTSIMALNENVRNSISNEENRLYVNFGSTKKKMITEIEATTYKTATLLIVAEGGTYTYSLGSGDTTIKCNITSRSFTIYTNSQQNLFELRKLKFKYRIFE